MQYEVGRNPDSEPIYCFTACCQSCDRLGVISRTTITQIVTVIAGSKRRSLLMARDDDDKAVTGIFSGGVTLSLNAVGAKIEAP